MHKRPSPAAVCAILALVAFTAWITAQAKSLERDLQSNASKIALLNKAAPDFHLTTLDGRPVSLSNYHGRKLVLLFWASWNTASHPRMQALANLYQHNHTADSDFDIAAISVDNEPAAARAFVTQTGATFPVMLDQDRKVTSAYQISTVPTTLVIDAAGKVVYGGLGFGQRGRDDELLQQLGIRGNNFRMEMRGPYGGRGN